MNSKRKEEESVEKDVFEKMFEAYYLRVYSFVLTLSSDTHLAEEITQETFFRALTAQKAAFKGQSDEVTWLCAIAKNLYMDELRRQKKRADEVPETDSGTNLEKAVTDKEMSFHIHRILHSIEEPYREVFELRVFGELSFKEIGMIFQKTENWARVTYHRARLKIQERMEVK